MKSQIKNNFKYLILLIIFIQTITGCGPATNAFTESEQMLTDAVEKAQTMIALTDAPSDDFQSVEVDILSPLVFKKADGSSVEIPLPDHLSIHVDLLTLYGVSDILSRVDLPAGDYTGIRMTIANPAVVLASGESVATSNIDLPNRGVVDTTGTFTITADPSTILVDFDVADSFHVDAARDGRWILKPIIRVKAITDEIRPDERELKEMKGVIARIPGIRDDKTSFLMKLADRSVLAQVDVVEGTKIMTASGDELSFDALKVEQHVAVAGFMTRRGLIEARTVVVFRPEREREGKRFHGLITKLNTADQLITLKSREGTEGGTTTISYSRETKVFFGRVKENMALTVAALSAGQSVSLFATKTNNGDLFMAKVVLIHPERLRGFITEISCDRSILKMTNPLHRLKGDLVARPLDASAERGTIMVDFKDAELLGYSHDPKVIPCDDLKVGIPIHVMGRLAAMDRTTAGDNAVKIVALTVKKVLPYHIKGTVKRVAPIEERGAKWMVQVPLPIHGFDVKPDCGKLATALAAEHSCDHINLIVVVGRFTYNPDELPLFTEAMINKDVKIAGVIGFSDLDEDGDKEPVLYAVVVRSADTVGIGPDLVTVEP